MFMKKTSVSDPCVPGANWQTPWSVLSVRKTYKRADTTNTSPSAIQEDISAEASSYPTWDYCHGTTNCPNVRLGAATRPGPGHS